MTSTAASTAAAHLPSSLVDSTTIGSATQGAGRGWRALARQVSDRVGAARCQDRPLTLGTVDRPLGIHATRETIEALADPGFEAADLGIAIELVLGCAAAWSCADRLMNADRRHAVTIELVDHEPRSERVLETVRRLAALGLEVRAVLPRRRDPAEAECDLCAVVEAGACDVRWREPDTRADWLRLALALPRRPVGRG